METEYVLERNKITQRAPFGELNLNLGKAKSLQQNMVRQTKATDHTNCHSTYDQIEALEAKNENLASLVEKLLTENSRYENSFLAIKSSQAKLLNVNKKLCEVVTHLKQQVNEFKRKHTKVESLYRLFKSICLDDQDHIVLQKSTLKKLFEVAENQDINNDIALVEPVEIKASFNSSFMQTI